MKLSEIVERNARTEVANPTLEEKFDELREAFHAAVHSRDEADLIAADKLLLELKSTIASSFDWWRERFGDVDRGR